MCGRADPLTAELLCSKAGGGDLALLAYTSFSKHSYHGKKIQSFSMRLQACIFLALSFHWDSASEGKKIQVLATGPGQGSVLEEMLQKY